MTAGKTLLLNTVDRFLSNQYEDQARLFEGLAIWEEEKFRKLQGSLPVIFLSFADVKQASYDGAVEQFRRLINELYQQFSFLTDSVEITEGEKQRFESYASYFAEMTEGEIAGSLRFLASLLYQHYGQKVIILLDEYDTPIGKHKPHMGNEVLCR